MIVARRTRSELVFEDLLSERGLPIARIPEGARHEPDYSVEFDSHTLIFEVKEFHHPRRFPTGKYDPLRSVRNKIGAARKQFKNYEFVGASELRRDMNTAISAVIAMLPLRVYHRSLRDARRAYHVFSEHDRKLTKEEEHSIRADAFADPTPPELVMRMVVLDNPYARRRLPKELFRGPYDERWASTEHGRFGLEWSGARIAEMRTILPDYALKLMGLW